MRVAFVPSSMIKSIDIIDLGDQQMTTSVSAIRSGGRLVDVMRQLAGGVCVITAGRAPTRTGYTGTAVFSLSVEPERGCRSRSLRDWCRS